MFHTVRPPSWLRWPASAGWLLSSLKLRITLATIAALALSISATTAFLQQRAERSTLAAQQERELHEAVRTASVLSNRVVALQRALGAAASQLSPDLIQQPEALEAFMRQQVVLRDMFASVSVATADGEVLITGDGKGVSRRHINLKDRDYFQRTLAERRPVVSEALPGRLSGEPLVIFTYPLQTSNGVYGVIGGSLRLAGLDLMVEMVNALDDNGSQGLLVISDAQGRILAHPQDAWLMRNLDQEPRLQGAFRRWKEGGQPVEPLGLRMVQADEIVTAAGVAGPDWMLWRAVPEAQLLAPLRTARHQALVWACGLVAAMSLLTLGLLWWLLRPLSQLEHRAQNLFNGQDDPHAGWPRAGGEIGQLSRVLRHVGAERKQLEDFNGAVLSKLSSVMAAAPLGIAFTRAGRFELVSTEFCRLFGLSEPDLIGQTVSMIFATDADHQACQTGAMEAFGAGQSYDGEWRLRRRDGTLFWSQLRGRQVDPADPEAGVILTLDNIDEQVAARTRLEWLATHDALTGLANRKVFEQRLAKVFEARPRSLPTAVVIIDLDHFKPINDTAGHGAGDAMLKAVTEAICARVRSGDLVVRLGGDEFALLLERCPHSVALRVAESVRIGIAQIVLPWEGRELRVGASIGVSSLTEQIGSVAEWVDQADAACYAAKAEGRGAVRVAALRVA